MKPDNVIRIPCTLNSIFNHWLRFLEPFHHLTAKELEVAACFLRERYQLSKVILNETIIDKMLFTEEMQKKIREQCDLKNQHFQVIKTKLKQKRFLIDRGINPRLVPNIKEEEGLFKLMLAFDYQDSLNEVSADSTKGS